MRNILPGGNLLCLLLSGSLLVSCQRPLEKAEYQAYLQDEAYGLTLIRRQGQAALTCTYRPTDLLISQELAGAEQAATSDLLDSLRRNYAGKTYVALALTQSGQEIENQFAPDQNSLAQAVSYLNGGIAQDIFLVPAASPTDSVAAYTAVYPRLYGSTGRSTVLLVFNTQQLNISQGFTISYRDTFFQLGTTRFPFTAQALSNLPSLRY